MSIGKGLTNALRSLAGGPTWTMTMTEDFYAQALKLEQLGLVKFKPRIITRGKFRGETRGYDVVVTAAGHKELS